MIKLILIIVMIFLLVEVRKINTNVSNIKARQEVQKIRNDELEGLIKELNKEFLKFKNDIIKIK